jgi:hypothetical protein
MLGQQEINSKTGEQFDDKSSLYALCIFWNFESCECLVPKINTIIILKKKSCHSLSQKQIRGRIEETDWFITEVKV